mgnify:CR=1 FL=1
MSEKYVNFIGMYDNIFPDGFCDHLIVTFEKLVERGLCYSRKQSESTRKVVKDDFAFSLDINSHSELGTFNGESVSSIVIDAVQNCFDSYIDNYTDTHEVDKTKKSKVYTTVYYTNSENDDHIRVECTDWSNKIEKERNWSDNLGVSAVTDEINKWYISGYE